MGQLAKTLQSYYKRQGNRIIFLSGMTLNQLALEMWEKLGCREIDASVLSRVINGKRLFSLHQLRVFCQLLSLNKKQSELLNVSLQQDHIQKLGLELPLSAEFLDLVNLGAKQAYRLRISGAPHQLIEWLEAARALTLKTLRKTNSSKDRYKIKKTLSRIFVELNRTYAEIALPSEALKTLKASLKRQLNLAKEIKDKQSLGFTYANLGDAYYVDKKYKQSAFYFSKASELVNDPYWKLESLRAKAISLAYLKEEKEFKKTEKTIRKFINAGEFSDPITLCSTFEGIGRGKALLNSPEAHQVLAEGYQYCQKAVNKGKIIIFPQIQLARSNLFAARRLKINSQISTKFGEEALLLATTHGYTRHAQRIKHSLNLLLN